MHTVTELDFNPVDDSHTYRLVVNGDEPKEDGVSVYILLLFLLLCILLVFFSEIFFYTIMAGSIV